MGDPGNMKMWKTLFLQVMEQLLSFRSKLGSWNELERLQLYQRELRRNGYKKLENCAKMLILFNTSSAGNTWEYIWSKSYHYTHVKNVTYPSAILGIPNFGARDTPNPQAQGNWISMLLFFHHPKSCMTMTDEV